MFVSLKSAAVDALTSSRWWRQQSWLITTEVLMGFLAAWGLARDIAPASICLGLGLVYAISSLGMRLGRSQGYRAGVLMLLVGLSASLMAVFLEAASSWYGLCVAIGTLLFFRDQQTADMLAWMPVRAKRRGLDNATALRATTLLSGVSLAVSLFAAGFLVRAWPWIPHVMVLMALVWLVPGQLRTMGRPRAIIKPTSPAHWQPSHGPALSWLLRLALAFNSVSFLGRRLLLPASLLMIASNMGYGDSALPILGATLGFMGLVGTLVRPPARFSQRLGPYGFVRWGARLSLAGWGLLAAGATVWAWWGSVAAIPVMLGGWVLLELTSRMWSVAYVDCLRISSTGARMLATRAHRQSLHQFMIHKSAGGAISLGMASLFPPAMLPLLVFAFVVSAFVALENDPGLMATEARMPEMQ